MTQKDKNLFHSEQMLFYGLWMSRWMWHCTSVKGKVIENICCKPTLRLLVAVVSESPKQSSAWEDCLTMFGQKKAGTFPWEWIVCYKRLYLACASQFKFTGTWRQRSDTLVDSCMHKQTQKVSHLSLSATKMTLRSSKREAKTRTTCRTLRQENRLSKSTCSSLESIGLLNSITWRIMWHYIYISLKNTVWCFDQG